MNGLGGSMFRDPSTGQISIKNEFPFAINPAFHQYGAFANPALAVPGLPEWGGREGPTTGPIGPTEDKNIIAQLPSVPQEPIWMMLFVIALFGGLIFIRIRHRIKIVRKDDSK